MACSRHEASRNGHGLLDPQAGRAATRCRWISARIVMQPVDGRRQGDGRIGAVIKLMSILLFNVMTIHHVVVAATAL